MRYTIFLKITNLNFTILSSLLLNKNFHSNFKNEMMCKKFLCSIRRLHIHKQTPNFIQLYILNIRYKFYILIYEFSSHRYSGYLQNF